MVKDQMFINGIPIIESHICFQPYRLDDYTQELMGPQWCKDFHAWADINLPKQPGMYLLPDSVTGKQVIVAHPDVIQHMVSAGGAK